MQFYICIHNFQVFSIFPFFLSDDSKLVTQLFVFIHERRSWFVTNTSVDSFCGWPSSPKNVMFRSVAVSFNPFSSSSIFHLCVSLFWNFWNRLQFVFLIICFYKFAIAVLSEIFRVFILLFSRFVTRTKEKITL